MTNEIRIGSQVVTRRVLRTGNQIRLGTVVAMSGEKATVNIPSENVRLVVPVKTLELASNRFPGGRVLIESNPIRRGVL